MRNEGDSIQAAITRVWEHGYNRLPVFRKNVNKVVGVLTLSTWDLLLPDIQKRPSHIPRVGDTVQDRGYRYTVIEADECMVNKVRIERV